MDNTPNVELINQWLWFAVQLARVIAWPLVVGLLACWNRAGILSLLSSLARRALKLKGPGGIEATLDAISEQGGDAGTKITEAPIVPSGSIGSSGTPMLSSTLPLGVGNARAAVEHLEAGLRAQLAGTEPSQQNALLLRALAETRVRAGHESVYNRIFGSQIAAIKELERRGKATVAEAKQFYDSLIPRFPDMYPTYSFELWLGFMVGAGLVARDGDALTPTIYGHDFIVYIADTRLNADKPF